MIEFTESERKDAIRMLLDGVKNIDAIAADVQHIKSLILTYECSLKKVPSPAVQAAKQIDLDEQTDLLAKSRKNLLVVLRQIRQHRGLTEKQGDKIVELLDDVRKIGRIVNATSEKFNLAVKAALEQN